jgi:flagellar assembly protein FliH
MSTPIKIIRDGADEFQRWEAPAVEVSADSADSLLGLLTAEQLAGIQDVAFREAREQGYAEGYKRGIDAARAELAQKNAELQKRVQQFDQLLRAFSHPFERLDEQIEQELLALAVAIARQIVRREIKTDPGQIVAVVREVMSMLPGSARHPQVFLHPEDAAFVRQVFSLSGEHESWRLIEDPTLTRGDCRVATENSRVDATIENRLAAIMASTLGGEREEDRSDS